MKSTPVSMQLHAASGARLYLNRHERLSFMRVAKTAPIPTRSLCLTLAYTGCRVSEALALQGSAIDTTNNVIAFRSLKKRQKLHIREVPVPPALIKLLSADHTLTEQALDQRLWQISRTTAWRRIKRVMATAHVTGIHASPKGLRHGFGVAAIQAGVPLNLLQKWMGHANIGVTAIYANAMGPEEYAVAKRMW
ncbi:tyrosine-type recombinase/integrase [Salaquimonas pukyongi]|uniref:tyrosine-type recombinase/integrase n=1 Tax=Salaquimonas pukyongi TaxID=2712698 RepID=UPI00096B6CA2|nr:site-specific integrase [Salaquimonas pukyongi]